MDEHHYNQMPAAHVGHVDWRALGVEVQCMLWSIGDNLVRRKTGNGLGATREQ